MLQLFHTLGYNNFIISCGFLEKSDTLPGKLCFMNFVSEPINVCNKTPLSEINKFYGGTIAWPKLLRI